MSSSIPPPASGRTNILGQQSRSRIAYSEKCNYHPSRFRHITTPASQNQMSSASDAGERMKKAREAAKDLIEKGGPEAKRLLG